MIRDVLTLREVPLPGRIYVDSHEFKKHFGTLSKLQDRVENYLGQISEQSMTRYPVSTGRLWVDKGEVFLSYHLFGEGSESPQYVFYFEDDSPNDPDNRMEPDDAYFVGLGSVILGRELEAYFSVLGDIDNFLRNPPSLEAIRRAERTWHKTLQLKEKIR